MGTIIPPGSVIGLLGGGQLGRMFAIAARRMGYRVHTYEPAPDSPAGQISDAEFTGAYTDEALVRIFAESVDVVTFEFENIPARVVDDISIRKPVFPRSEVLHICQNREREKNFLRKQGYPHAPFALVTCESDLRAALETIGRPSILKTADFGYDGKGQIKIDVDATPTFAAFAGQRAILERWIDFESELSVICARDQLGRTVTFPVSENVHSRHILEYSVVPARMSPEIQAEAQKIAGAIANDLDVIGLIAVEFFVDRHGALYVNELAPRPHNSGHYTVDACVTSQFEQQLRAVCGLPFGATDLHSPVVMVNLLGDLWRKGHQPDWTPILAEPRAKLHLYGKLEGRPGRKMGHFCLLDADRDVALERALQIKAALERSVLE
jgi:5-(carboxyamino)imidazole ribonucleotide synthase